MSGEKLRVVLDSNVLLSALFTHGLCSSLYQACIGSDLVQLVISDYIVDEVLDHAERFNAPDVDRTAIAAFLRRHSELVTPVAVPDDACADRDDLPVLGTAEAGRASVLVTGDKELLKLKQFRNTIIVSPRQFYDRLMQS